MAAHRGDPALDDPWYGVRDGPVKAPAPARSASGAEETRTPDPLLAKEVLYQLSYGPKSGCAAFGAGSHGIIGPGEREWAFLDSNQRPLPYQGSALTS